MILPLWVISRVRNVNKTKCTTWWQIYVLDLNFVSFSYRNVQVAAVIESLERDMELLCITGVEDKLQDNVRNTLEQLRNAGIRVSNYHLFKAA